MPEQAVTFEEMQKDFIVRRKGSLALPLTGVIVYSAAALLSLCVDPACHNLVLALCFWAIMPVGLFIGRLRGEEMRNVETNPLFDLSAKARVMALATWAIHIPVWIYAPTLFPVTVGIGFALHWIVFSWTTGHPVGFIHLGMRILFVLCGLPNGRGRGRRRLGLCDLARPALHDRLARTFQLGSRSALGLGVADVQVQTPARITGRRRYARIESSAQAPRPPTCASQ